MHYDGIDLKPAPLIERRLKLTELVLRSDVHCLHPVQAFDDGAKLPEAAERHGLEGIVSKRQASPYRSGPSRDWVKTKTVGELRTATGGMLSGGADRTFQIFPSSSHHVLMAPPVLACSLWAATWPDTDSNSRNSRRRAS